MNEAVAKFPRFGRYLADALKIPIKAFVIGVQQPVITGGRIPAQTFALFMKPVLEANPPSSAIVTAPIQASSDNAEVSLDEGIILENESGSIEKSEVIEDTSDIDTLLNQVAEE